MRTRPAVSRPWRMQKPVVQADHPSYNLLPQTTSCFHTFLVVTTGDLEDVASVLRAEDLALNLMADALVVEVAAEE